MREISRIPVCKTCLEKPRAASSEFFCVCCRTPFRNRSPLDETGRCALCRAGQRGFDAAYSFGEFEDELRELIHLFKYGGVAALAKPLGRCMRLALPAGERFDFLVPMPLHWTRAWKRGYNQASLLASEISRGTDIPMVEAVRRLRRTPAQAGLTHAQRRDNMVNAFAAQKKDRIGGKRILLVDDVMTTGATASACARALKKAGASYVALLTLARADRRDFSVVSASLFRGASHSLTHTRSTENA